jgi:hypothetical protein
VIISCSQKSPQKEISRKLKPHTNLISCKINYGVTDEEMINRNHIGSKEFNPKTDTIKYIGNEIQISYLEALTGCVEYGGDMEIKNDSLILKLVTLNNEECPELEFARVTYRIKNAENIKYKISKR